MKAVLFSDAPQGSEQWLQARHKGVGASDAAAALGLSQYKSPHQLWQEKRGLVSGGNDNWFMQRGRAMEPVLRQHYATTRNESVLYIDGILRHPEIEIMLLSLDGYTENGRLLEFKTSVSRKGWGEPGSDIIPTGYMIQVQQALDITGFEVADVGVSFNGAEPEYYEVRADKELQQMIEHGIQEFWKKVVSGIEPDPSTVEEYRQRYTIHQGKTVFADGETNQKYLQLADTRSAIKPLEADKEALEDEIKKLLAVNGADTLVDGLGNRLVTWNEAKGRESIDSKRLKAEKPDVYEAYKTTGKPYRIFKVLGE